MRPRGRLGRLPDEPLDVGLGDALAYTYTEERGLTEIYSFDKDFDRIGDVKRVSE